MKLKQSSTSSNPNVARNNYSNAILKLYKIYGQIYTAEKEYQTQLVAQLKRRIENQKRKNKDRDGIIADIEESDSSNPTSDINPVKGNTDKKSELKKRRTRKRKVVGPLTETDAVSTKEEGNPDTNNGDIIYTVLLLLNIK